MADAEKPYRLYKGGRTRGKVPTAPRPERPGRAESSRATRPGKPRWRRRIGLTMLVLGVLLLVWLVPSYLAFRSGVKEANARLPKAVEASLAPQDGLLLTNPSLIMLLGTDGDKTAARQDFRRSDSILLVRTDPKRHRMAYLTIPRDLRVDIPGQGPNKINAAFQLGGPALTMKTVQALTGLQPNHVVLVDFDNFREVIDALGGVEIDVPKPILSNRFDCPYATEARCQEWPGWRFSGVSTRRITWPRGRTSYLRTSGIRRPLFGDEAAVISPTQRSSRNHSSPESRRHEVSPDASRKTGSCKYRQQE